MGTCSSLIIGMIAALTATSALAQETSGGLAPGGQVTQAKDNPTLHPTELQFEPASIAALQGISNIAHELYDEHGLLFRAVLKDDLQGNPTGGVKQSYANGGGYTLGIDWNLGRDLNDPGGTFHLGVTQFYGKGVNHDIGNAIKSQGWYYSLEQFNLSQFAIEQNFFGKQINVYVGRVNATSPFAKATYGCEFISGSACPSYLPLTTGGLSSWPYVTWGGRVRYLPTPKTYVQAGAYEVNPTRKYETGFDWSLAHSTGYVLPVEIGYGTDFSNDSHPRHFKLGGWYNSAPFTDPLLNTKGISRVQHGGSAATLYDGHGGIYALADQVVYRPQDGSRRNLAVFASFSAPFDPDEIFQSQSIAGAFWTGPFKVRPHDKAGIQLTYIVFSGHELEYQNQLLAKAGSHSFVDRDQVNVEANYGFQIVRGIFFYPDFEYLINPDISARLGAKKAPKDAAIFGVRLSIDLGRILGIPSVETL